MSKVTDSAIRGKMIVDVYGGDIVYLLSDIDAYCITTGRQNLTVLGVYAHQITKARSV